MKPGIYKRYFPIRAQFIILITGLVIGLVFGGVCARAQMDDTADTPPGISKETDSIEGLETEEGALGLDPAQVYDVPGEEYEDIEEDYEEEILEEEEILDDYYEEEEDEFESEFEEYDVEEMESPGEDHTIGTQFEEIDPGELETEEEEDHTIGTQFEEIDPRELESAPEGVTAQ
ncbi:MAG: hypothetical protein ACOC3W_04925 [Thermodesulfobacteriota bacterium]